MAIDVALLVVAAVAVLAPHALALDRVSPHTAGAVWLLVLFLRALLAVGGTLWIVVDLHRTGVGVWVSDRILHQVLDDGFGLHLHAASHVVALLPAALLVGCLVWFATDLVRGWLGLRRTLARALGTGPHGAIVVPDSRVLVAVPVVGRGRIVLSDSALSHLDPAELDASVAHELGHLRRRHRPLLLLGSLLASIGAILPGTRAAKRELALSLERDADDYAVRTTGDPLSLASAICKAAVTAPRGTAALGGHGAVTMRLHRLVDEPARPTPVLERSGRSLAILLVTIAVGVIELLVTWMLTAPDLAHLLAIENLLLDH